MSYRQYRQAPVAVLEVLWDQVKHQVKQNTEWSMRSFPCWSLTSTRSRWCTATPSCSPNTSPQSCPVSWRMTQHPIISLEPVSFTLKNPNQKPDDWLSSAGRMANFYRWQRKRLKELLIHCCLSTESCCPVLTVQFDCGSGLRHESQYHNWLKGFRLLMMSKCPSHR